ncbi:hypothetical protein Tco_0272990 [Tanacetum coccineum]
MVAHYFLRVDKDTVVPHGTNIWIDVLSMHRYKKFLGEGGNEFKSESFEDDAHGGFGGREVRSKIGNSKISEKHDLQREGKGGKSIKYTQFR